MDRGVYDSLLRLWLLHGKGVRMTAYVVIACEHIDMDQMLAGNQCNVAGCGAVVVELLKVVDHLREQEQPLPRDQRLGIKVFDRMVSNEVGALIDAAREVAE